MFIKKIVILFSGEGTNLENIIKKLHNKEFNDTKIVVSKAITNNPLANGIKRAKREGVEVEIIDHKKYTSREEFDKELVKAIKKESPDLVVLAGFMRILTPIFTENIKNAINIHPSILPLFKGANALKRSFESDMKVAGVTVHKVSSELDSGEILEQDCFKKDRLSFEEFEKRIHELEYEIYPKVIVDILIKKK
ncbi:phosphoribosylglycinamide formyltransferase [Nitrosophilus kaiyonis]|uniref:phosphoribosylglycinamide formyltransferase n=1 Tax=Nitrosophilus kaiyonis TaxID=2930200 RepID=UPI002490BC02|nr:phosphoribosylglycinamide formyltransferase [Nitrosophilus kaiyonis]